MDNPTIIEVPEMDVIPDSGESHHKGWLTGEGYLAWVTTHEGVLASSCPIAQPPAFDIESCYDDIDPESEFESAA